MVHICYMADHLGWLNQKKAWFDLRAATVIKSTVTIGDTVITEACK
jgi:hypothetical protein